MKQTELQNAILLVANHIPGAFLVGGYIRDKFFGITSTDADMEVHGIEAKMLESELEKLFPGKVFLVGKSFGVFKIAITKEYTLDISLPRREKKAGFGHTEFHIQTDPHLSHEEAARRRDFTINAIGMDPLTEKIIDPFNGVQDIQNKILRAVDAATFVEDPLRAFRAIQLAARFNLTIHEQTLDILQDMAARGETATLSHERIGQEFKKLLLKAEKPSIGLELAKKIGLIARHFPTLQELEHTKQDPEWHPEGNVWIHTCMVVDEAARLSREQQLSDEDRFKVIFGCLAHDLGKPAKTQTSEDGHIHAHGHEEAGAPLAESLATLLRFPHAISEAAFIIASEHRKPDTLHKELTKGNITEDQYANSLRRLLRRILPMDWKLFLLACEADWRGRAFNERAIAPYEIGIVFEMAMQKYNVLAEAKTSLIQGRDLIELGLAPSARMGEIIDAIEAARDDGRIRTREDALVEATKLITSNDG